MLNQEGSLLDSEGGVGSLGADWSISVPVGISSHLGATAELAEIFGTSDDEDESFNFNLNTGLSLAKDLGLDEEAKKFDSSPILNVAESQLFLNSMQDAISIDPKDSVGAAGKGAEGVKIELGEELLDSPSPQTGEGNSVTSVGESREDGDDGPKRKSIRIRKRMEDVAAKVQDFSRDRKLSRVEFGEGGVKVYSSARTSGEGKLDETDTQGAETQTATCKEEEEGTGGSDGDEGDESDDPDKLWCVCRQPHGDRFMICCDCCGEWYHGDCIGISVSQGKRMERAGEDYVCVSCQERERLRKEQKEADRKLRLAKREQAKEKDAVGVSVKSEDHTSSLNHAHDPGSAQSHAHHTSGSTSGEEQYGVSELFKPDNASKNSREAGPALGGQEAPSRPSGGTPPEVQPKEGEPKPPPSLVTDQKLKVKQETRSTSCTGPDCSRVATPPSVYCSDRCIERHAAKMLRVLAKRGVIVQTTPGEFVRGGGGVSVVERATGKMVMGLSAPSEKKLVGWLKTHPSYQVFLPHGKGVKTKGGGLQKREAAEITHKPAKPALDEDSIRTNAKKALFQTLWTRCEGMSDLDVGEEKVAQIAALIEDKLYDAHKDITPKYKMKYRSLLFNLKDTKNQGLFRKVLMEEVTPELLVQMSPEELASEELAHWREQAMKKDLEMIKIREVEEAQNMVGTIRKMTYKGEVEIEVPEMAMTVAMETVPFTQQSEMMPKVEQPGAQGEGAMPDKPKYDSKDVKSHFKMAESKPSILDLLDSTTANHGSHVFDHRCDICMGKAAPSLPPPPPPPPTSLQPPSPLTPPPPPLQTDTSNASTPDSSVPVTSEDNVQDTPEPRSPDPNMEPIWHGSITMHLLPKFNACAYKVSGVADGLSEVLPEALQVMGRIAYVQVWDYLEQLQKSTTRDITVLRLDWMEGDYDAYTEMLQYLVSKHRCGVVQSGFGGVKDFYLVPLMRTDEIPPQLLPLRGPGLSHQRSDMLLAVIVRSRAKPPPPRSIREARHTHSSHKRHHADSSSEGSRSKRVRFQVEKENRASVSPSPLESNPVRLGAVGGSLGATKAILRVLPPLQSVPQVTMAMVVTEITSSLIPSAPTSLTPTPTSTVQMSFYGQALSSPPVQAMPLQGGVALVDPPAALPSSNELVPIITSSAVSSILSQLTDEKIKELASAMSALSSTTAMGQVTGPQAQVLPAVAVQESLAIAPIDSSAATSISSVPAPSELQLAPTDAVRPLHQPANVYPSVTPAVMYSSAPPTAPYTTTAPLVTSGYPSDAQPTTGYPVAPGSVAIDYQSQGVEGYAHQTAPYPQDPSYQYPVLPPAAPYSDPSAYHQGTPAAYYSPDQGSSSYPSNQAYTPGAYPSQYPDPNYGYAPQGDPRGYHGDPEQEKSQYYHRDYSDASQSWNGSRHRNYDDERRGDPRDYAPKGRDHPREWKQRSGRFRYEGGYDGSYDRR